MKQRELTKAELSGIIAHRLSTIRNCDRIILLDKGKIAEEGTHDELIKLKGNYRRLWAMQQGNYKAANKTEEEIEGAGKRRGRHHSAEGT